MAKTEIEMYCGCKIKIEDYRIDMTPCKSHDSYLWNVNVHVANKNNN